MKRRSFIQSASLLTAPLLLNGIPISAVGRASMLSSLVAENDRVLVLIQLNGGNDGLNTIIPLDQYDKLANVRSNVILPENSIIGVNDMVGFHPALSGMKALYDDARMMILQDVGYPDQNRSHFRSTDIWTTGSPAAELYREGWLGRYFEQNHASYPEGYPSGDFPDPFALTLGSIVSETCQGSGANFSLALNNPFNISPLPEEGQDVVPDTPYGDELTFLRTTIEQTNAYGDTIVGSANAGNNIADYPDNNSLASQLETIALLISGGLGTKIYIANIGGFDTHANQVDPTDSTIGVHNILLDRLSLAVEAFQEDLRLLGLDKRVITMTFSEFGRRIRSNESLGTDHGTAAPLMIFGSCVNAGIMGNSPEIPVDVGVQDGIPMQFDFRNIYGSVLMNWFGVAESDVKNLLMEEFQHIPIIEGCELPTTVDEGPFPYTEEIKTYNYPNPFSNWTTIVFESRGERARIGIYDSLGSELKILCDRFFSAGKHELKFEARSLAPGNYFYSVFTETGVKTKAMVKI